LFIKNIPENNLEEEEQGHTTALSWLENHMTYENCWMQLNVCSSFL